jgi:hypothetical protein
MPSIAAPLLPEMYDSVGDGFVLERVEEISVQNTRLSAPNMPCVCRITNPVLLEGGICHGGGIGCDRDLHFGAKYGCGGFSASFVDKTRSAEISRSAAG